MAKYQAFARLPGEGSWGISRISENEDLKCESPAGPGFP